MVKTKVTRDITNEQCLTPSGTIKTPLCVAQHARATFCTEESYPPSNPNPLPTFSSSLLTLKQMLRAPTMFNRK